MRMIAARSARLRPMVSPTWPKMRPPTGRMKKAPANTVNVDMVAATGSSAGKNAALNAAVM